MAKSANDLVYSFVKLRKNFGKQPMFCETPSVLLDTIVPDKREQKMYCLRNPVNREMQTSISISEHEINTKRIIIQDTGINHFEGGWPKDINSMDEESTNRYKRKVERDDAYVDCVLGLYPEFVHYVDQNNAIEMYDLYFKSMPSQQPVEILSIRINNVYKDSYNRPISSIGWTQEDDSKLVVSYCNKKYPVSGHLDANLSGFVWDINRPNEPFTEFCPPSACWQIACSPVQPQVIVGGLQDGRVCIFDIRAKKEPVALNQMHLAHRDPITALLYIHSRLNTEFFSGSTDGQCMWWDIRNIAQPIDALIMCIRIPPGEQMSFANAEGISALQFDRSFPTKFLCGTDTGFVINVNRKGKTYNEVMSAIFQAHNGPVKAIHRSPCTSKMFITCGDWSVNIWSDDIHTSPIISGIGHRYQITDVVWAPQRVSSYMSISTDGKFGYWDLLRRFSGPVTTLRVSNHSLLKIKPNEEGKLIAIGDMRGALYLLSLSENLVLPGNKDKQLMIQTYDRETRREHILETRIKEIRLKLKTEEDGPRGSVNDAEYDENVLRCAEEEYRKIVFDEIRRTGTTASPTKQQKMRKR